MVPPTSGANFFPKLDGGTEEIESYNCHPKTSGKKENSRNTDRLNSDCSKYTKPLKYSDHLRHIDQHPPLTFLGK